LFLGKIMVMTLNEAEIELQIDRIVQIVVEEMKTMASSLFPNDPEPEALPRLLVQSSIVWTSLNRKLQQKLDDVRHEHLLTMRQLVGK